MRTLAQSALALLGLAVAGAASAQSTPVIGYYKQNMPAGLSAAVCAFVTKTDFQGLATAVSSTSITRTGSFVAGAYAPTATAKYYVEILDGAWEGLNVDITGNDANSLQVAENVAMGGYNLAQTVKFCVRKHATVNTIFPNGAGFSAGDTITLVNPSLTLTTDGATGWYDENGDPFNSTVISPAEGMLIYRQAQGLVTVGGNEVSYVKTSKTRSSCPPNSLSLVGVMNPLVGTAPSDKSTILSIGFPNDTAAPLAALDTSDTISTYASSAGGFGTTGTFLTDGAAMYTVDGDPVTTEAVPNGAAYGIYPTGATVKSVLQDVVHPIN
jgi:hypothetical protein